MRANKLFGGKQKIVENMGKMVCKRLKDISDEDAASLEEDLLLKRGTINALRKGRKKVNIALFERLAGSLQISVREALGSPEWGSFRARRKWEAYKRQNWFARTLPFPSEAEWDIPLETYVALKAAAEVR